jgi:hypothetical protein
VTVREPDPLVAELQRLAEASPQARGYGLEGLVGRLFRRAHFRIERNPGLAKPRQTDLLAEGAGATFLIETKWRSKPATVADIDALRGRLDRSQSGVIGVLISLSGFTATAITAVLERRDRPVLLLDRPDLERACTRDFDLRRMLRVKQDALRLQAEVLVGSQEPPFQRPWSSSDPPVDGDAYLLMRDGSRVPWVSARGSFSGFTFSRELNDPDWVSAPGAGVTFDLPLSVRTVSGVTHALSELSSLGWATGAGHWSIAQSKTNWHGIGPANLAEALLQWKKRYHDAGSLHHTEQVVYQDVCDDGFYTLSFDVDASDRRLVWHAEMSLQLSGIPLDLDPIRELCRTFDVQARTRFRPSTQKMLNRIQLRGDASIEVKPVAFVVEEQTRRPAHREFWVCGLVIKNPYYERARRARELPEQMPRPLRETDSLLCDLGSWHQLGKKLKYRLEMCEWAQTSDALVARVVADWIDPERADRTGKPDRPPRPRADASS